MVNSLIKWPGGKSREIKYIENIVPDFDRYVEPFFGGGAMYFFLKPKNAIINDVSVNLIDFYIMVKRQDKKLQEYLLSYDGLFKRLNEVSHNCFPQLKEIYIRKKQGCIKDNDFINEMKSLTNTILEGLNSELVNKLVLNQEDFNQELLKNSINKIKRTIKNDEKAPFNEVDLEENLITGYVSGLYMYFRNVFNDILLKRSETPCKQYDVANFYFIREYCYGSMFRYNSKGEFNIPYGGMTYNKKNFKSKIVSIFNTEIQELFSGTDIYCKDFEVLLKDIELSEKDFIFLDPPYDTDFSDYEGKDFSQNDQKRLADVLRTTKAKFILVIKNTEFIYSLYNSPEFNILIFDKTYSYNVRSRNERDVEHLIITNIVV